MDGRVSADKIETSHRFTIGIGASAGGLEALQSFLSHLPHKHDYAIVIVQHLDPDHDSLLSELLSKCTRTPVQAATDGMALKGGNVYLIPPGKALTISDNVLHTADFDAPRGRRRPIDRFFETLAADQGANAVAIVMSGTGSDGSVGIRAVKEHGGLVFVQEPEQAKYDGMPRSAIETGAHDLVLPVSEMLDVMNDYVHHMDGLEPDVLTDAEFISRAMKHVRYRTGHDFSHYKPGTLLRRIAVRMSVLGITVPNDYLKELIESPSEAGRLFRDVLINVTSFFRDPQAFEQLKTQVIPEIVTDRGRDEEVRIWVPGCSTGQEAYTVAMLVADEIERLDVSPRVAIFGTDIDDEALRVARLGIYPNSISDEVPEHFLHKYFNWLPDGYEIASRLRDMVRFSNQSLVKDPPFSRLDLISCRNVLIYFDNDLQDEAMRVFQYGLLENRFLMLGTSESPALLDSLFEDVSRRNRIFSRRPGPPQRLDLRGTSHRSLDQLRQTDLPGETVSKPHSEALLHDFVPPYLLLAHDNQVLFTSDRAARYLQVKSGRPLLDVTKLVRPELETVVRRLINRRMAPGEIASLDFQGEIDGSDARIEVSRKPLPNGQQLIVLRDYLLPLRDGPAFSPTETAIEDGTYVRELEMELDDARQTIRTTIEELETSNEELKSSNEEMMSMNEELQSANEELTTTNEELNSKIAEVREVNSDLASFIASTQIATVFLDERLNLRSFTPEAQTVFRFVPEDRGRRIDDIGTEIDIEQLMDDCREVSRSGTIIETEYMTRDRERIFSARLVPYRAETEAPGGVVFTLVDVSNLRKLAQEAERQSELSRIRLNEIDEIYRVSPQAMALIGTDMTYQRANNRLAEINGIPPEAHIGKRIDEVVPDVAEKSIDMVKEVFRTGRAREKLRVAGQTPSQPGIERIFETDFYPVYGGAEIVSVGINVREITQEEHIRQELRRVMDELQHRVKNMLANVQSLVHRASRDATEERPLFDELAQRIEALAKTHTVLTLTNWRSAPLRAVIDPELSQVYGSDRVTLKGPEVKINSRAAITIGMAIHELATNAAKYGCFSNGGGTLELSWLRQDDGESDSYFLTWKERGGPKVVAPEKEGFGTKLIRSTIEGTLGGSVEVDWNADGMICRIVLPAETVSVETGERLLDQLEA